CRKEPDAENERGTADELADSMHRPGSYRPWAGLGVRTGAWDSERNRPGSHPSDTPRAKPIPRAGIRRVRDFPVVHALKARAGRNCGRSAPSGLSADAGPSRVAPPRPPPRPWAIWVDSEST